MDCTIDISAINEKLLFKPKQTIIIGSIKLDNKCNKLKLYLRIKYNISPNLQHISPNLQNNFKITCEKKIKINK